MTITQLFSRLESLKVTLWLDGEQLRFSAPKGVLTAELREQLVTRKAEIIAFLRESQVATHVTVPPILPVSRDQALSLSFAQERLWFLDQLIPDNPFYNSPMAMRLTGSLNILALEQSLAEIVQRHEILRTTFPMVDGVPIQVIHPLSVINYQLSVINLQNLPPDEQAIEVSRLSPLEVQRTFDLQQGPVFRATLQQQQAEEYLLLLTFHHIVIDGWSMDVLFQELSALYEAFAAGKSSPLSELPIQYADFAHWQRQWLAGQVLETQLNYWQQQLATAPQVLDMPTDHLRPPEHTFRGGSEDFEIPPELSRQLKSLSQQTGVTLFMISLTAFAILLGRYSGQQDIVIGSPIANRNRKEIESLIGFFVNTLALRIDLSGNPSFLDLLKQVRQVTLDAYAHQDLPFEQLVETLHPERDMSRNPLVQVMFAFQNAPDSPLELADLTLSPVTFELGTVRLDLEFDLWETSEQIVGLLNYYKDLFDASTIKRLLGHFQTLLTSILANPNKPISEYSLLSEAERHQLLVEWNDTKADYPVDKCIHQLFEEQVEKKPDAIAVVFEDHSLSYLALNQRANQLAHYLQTLGIKPDVLVGLYLERSLDMVIGLFGILKAGGAYLPLEPTSPPARLAVMLEDASVSVLLSQTSLQENLLKTDAKVVCLDQETQTLAFSQENPACSVQPSNLAYVIYTSGSTGKPKGVMIQHQSLVNFIATAIVEYRLTERDSVLQFASLSFDAAAEEIYPCLASGGKLVLRHNEMLNSIPLFLQHCQQLKLTVLDLPTAFWHQVIPELAITKLKLPESLRLVIIGGEHALSESVNLWQQWVGDFPQLINTYGPTEATVVATIYSLPRSAPLKIGQNLPIGSALRNVQTYVLDNRLQLVPMGVPGELHIGGIGLARGYLNRPALTTEKFISNPFSNDPKTRLYKTGDLVRYRPDGQIEYLGRIDNQVKIRGFRIELGEIEAVLAQHPQVQETVVTTHKEVSGNKLVGYLVSNATPTPTASELRGFLKDKLPDYMLPSFFFWLDTLPLTPSGKIDRRALPAPETLISPTDGQYVAPRTATEEILASIWAEVLGLKQVSIQDNFFERGGDSILSIQVVARANKAGLQVTPRLIFQHQTIAELVTKIGTSLTRQAEQGLVTGDVPLTPIQQWFVEQKFPEPHHYNQAVLLESPTDLNPAWLERIVQHWFVHHDALRLRFTKGDSIWYARQVDREQELPFQVVDLSNVPSQTQPYALEKVAAQQQASLNLSEGPLMRVVLFYLGADQPCRLFIVIHHLAVDGVSWQILLEDLQTAYHQLSRGEVIQWSPKTTSFQAWSYRLAEYAQSSTVTAELDDWLSLNEATPLPIDTSPPPSSTSSTHALTISLASIVQFTVSLPVAQTHALLNEVPAVYNTHINDVLLTALVQSFAQWTEQQTLLIDLEGHGREDLFEEVDLSRTVGWFTSVFPVLLDLRFATSVGDALKSIKEQLRRIPNRGINYGLLRYLNSETSAQLQNLPQAQVCFNYLGQFDKTVSGDSWLRFATEETGPIHSQLGNSPYLLEINGAITEGQLQLDWSYSKDFHQCATIEKLAQSFIEALKNLIAHCQSPDAGGYTPSDFAAAELSQDELDDLIDEFG